MGCAKRHIYMFEVRGFGIFNLCYVPFKGFLIPSTWDLKICMV